MSDDVLESSVTVGSSTKLPSVSSPSSEVSLTVEKPFAEAITELDSPPELTSAWVIVWVYSRMETLFGAKDVISPPNKTVLPLPSETIQPPLILSLIKLLLVLSWYTPI